MSEILSENPWLKAWIVFALLSFLPGIIALFLRRKKR